MCVCVFIIYLNTIISWQKSKSSILDNFGLKIADASKHSEGGRITRSVDRGRKSPLHWDRGEMEDQADKVNKMIQLLDGTVLILFLGKKNRQRSIFPWRLIKGPRGPLCVRTLLSEAWHYKLMLSSAADPPKAAGGGGCWVGNISLLSLSPSSSLSLSLCLGPCDVSTLSLKELWTAPTRSCRNDFILLAAGSCTVRVIVLLQPCAQLISGAVTLRWGQKGSLVTLTGRQYLRLHPSQFFFWWWWWWGG